MSDIKLNEGQEALWNEVGSRGDMFRAAMRDRAHESTRTSGHMTEIKDGAGGMLDAIERTDPVPEKVYDDESQHAVANHPNLHRTEPQHGELHEDQIEGYGDSGRVIAGEIHNKNEPQETVVTGNSPSDSPHSDAQPSASRLVKDAAQVVGHHMQEVAHVMTGAAVGLAHIVGDRAKELVHKAEEKLHAPDQAVVIPDSKQP
jgi:hypothetical protein